MKLIAALLLLSVAGSAQTTSSRLHKTLYALEVASCAVSLTDGITTWAGINAGAHETNPLLIGTSKGNINWAKLIGYKAIFCGAPIVFSLTVRHFPVQERNADLMVLPVVTSTIGLYGWATLHNLRVISDIRRERTP